MSEIGEAIKNSKAFQIIVVIFAISGCYLVMTPLWGIITGTAFGAANTVNASANALAYRHTTAALKFAPLWLYFVPIGIATALIVGILKAPRKEN